MGKRANVFTFCFLIWYLFPQIVYSSLYEIVVDFTRDYEAIKVALLKVEHYDKTCLANMLQAVKNVLSTNWGSQNYSQVLVFTDCGIGIGASSVKSLIETLKGHRDHKRTNVLGITEENSPCLPFSMTSKLSFVCLGNPDDLYYQQSTRLYQELFELSGQKGQLFLAPKRVVVVDQVSDESIDDTIKLQSDVTVVRTMITAMCETNYKQFEATLKCGGFGKLETPINIWPPPLVSLNANNENQLNRMGLVLP